MPGLSACACDHGPLPGMKLASSPLTATRDEPATVFDPVSVTEWEVTKWQNAPASDDPVPPASERPAIKWKSLLPRVWLSPTIARMCEPTDRRLLTAPRSKVVGRFVGALQQDAS